jgi:hypothetical protein
LLKFSSSDCLLQDGNTILRINGLKTLQFCREDGFKGSFQILYFIIMVKGIPVQAWAGPNVSRSLRLPDFNTIGI